MVKQRLDLLLVDRGLVDNQDKAKRLIMAGLVFTEQLRLDKPGMKVDNDISLVVKQKKIPYVGRGGLKLEKALKKFNIRLDNRIMVDVGSSTGGFTDCALKNGVNLSYAIDVGYNQLDWKLRNDKRVVVMERTNFRYVTPDMFKKGLPNFASIDVSFISLKLILPVLKKILLPNSEVVTLIKPQFEAKKEEVGNKGIVQNKEVHLNVLSQILSYAKKEGFIINDITFSPITGGDGNIEFLSHFGWEKENDGYNFEEKELLQLVHSAHSKLKQAKGL